MNTIDNKRLVTEFCAHFARSAIDDVLAMMTDDAIWWIVGKPRLFANAGTHSKAEMTVMWHDLYNLLDGGLRMDVTGMIAEGDQVAAEIRSHARTRTGRVYENDYHMLFTIRDGRISKVKEYTDLMHAVETFD